MVVWYESSAEYWNAGTYPASMQAVITLNSPPIPEVVLYFSS